MSSPYKTVAFYTLGCKLNFAESSTMSNQFKTNGYAILDFQEVADLYVINTCSVTENANKKARKIIRRTLRKAPLAKIVVVGCYAQLNPDQIAQIPGVSLIVGAEEKFNLIEQIEKNELNNIPKIINSKIEHLTDFNPSNSSFERTRSFLKIQDGCNYNCSFCTIPLARGKSRSAEISSTILEVNKIAESNIREIVLTGVNIGDFGLNHNENLIQLIKECDKINGIDRYRISSIEPNLLTDEIIEFIASSNKFLPHFHIPLQSGSDRILGLMKRRYKTDLYRDRINNIKSKISNACIGVDVIVGFPSENENHFKQTYDFLQELDISYFHVFSYSERDNTVALRIKNKVSNEIIASRSKTLHRLSINKKQKFYKTNIGCSANVLIENFDGENLSGYTENYIPVKIKSTINKVNKIIPVELIKVLDGEMLAEEIN